ncbi:MAG: glycosyltransferase [Elusimicrobiota bacterium]|nr:glycosyltransferase [Elusimicrobiota bacterium]
MNHLFFSVIIPTYNRATLLYQCLKSLSLQTFTDYEAFIIDDGSTDETPTIFKEFSGQKNWNFIRLNENHGQYYCRNIAIRQLKGKYVTFLDSDDLWLPNRLKKFAELIEKNPNAGFVFSNGYIMQDGVIIGKFFNEDRKIPTGKLPPYMAISNYWLPYVTTNVAFIREAINKVGYFREDMSHLEDMELYVRILKYYEVDYILEPVSIYRIHTLTKDPRSLTLNWEKGIEDFLITLQTAQPPKEIRTLLKEYVYYNQAVVFVKNAYGKNARKYLKEIKRNLKTTLCYLFSFTPRWIVHILRFIYKKCKILKLKFLGSEEFKQVEKWLKGEIEK